VQELSEKETPGLGQLQSQSRTSACKLYSQGEFVLGKVIPGANTESLQITIRPSVLNKGLTFSDLVEG